jgi:O-methyltransferase
MQISIAFLGYLGFGVGPLMSSWGRLKLSAKYKAKSVLRPLVFRYPPIGLQPERLQVWLKILVETGQIDGAVVEVGCRLGGTAAVSWNMLRNLGVRKRYICVDTFSGFVAEHFEDDLKRGNHEVNRWMFADNSIDLTRKILDPHNARGVELIRADIVTLPREKLPEVISAALLDVDLAQPIYEGLKKLYLRLVKGGVIVVDDCPESCFWKARQGYEQFCAEFGITPHYENGTGLVFGADRH